MSETSDKRASQFFFKLIQTWGHLFLNSGSSFFLEYNITKYVSQLGIFACSYGSILNSSAWPLIKKVPFLNLEVKKTFTDSEMGLNFTLVHQEVACFVLRSRLIFFFCLHFYPHVQMKGYILHIFVEKVRLVYFYPLVTFSEACLPH